MSIFTIEKRNEIQGRMLSVGAKLIREKGVRKMTVSDITERTGIGKGTFYHFYDSKELFIYDVIMFSKNSIKNAMNGLAEKNGKLTRISLNRLLTELILSSEGNILSSIPAEDMAWLLERLPENCTIDPVKEENIVRSILENCENANTQINYHVAANIVKIMALAVENKERLHQDAITENLLLMKEQLLDIIFGKEREEQ